MCAGFDCIGRIWLKSGRIRPKFERHRTTHCRKHGTISIESDPNFRIRSTLRGFRQHPAEFSEIGPKPRSRSNSGPGFGTSPNLLEHTFWNLSCWPTRPCHNAGPSRDISWLMCCGEARDGWRQNEDTFVRARVPPPRGGAHAETPATEENTNRDLRSASASLARPRGDGSADSGSHHPQASHGDHGAAASPAHR